MFLRLRKAVRAGTPTVYSTAALASQGLDKLCGMLLPTVPGREAAVLDAIGATADSDDTMAAPARARPARCASRVRSSWPASGWPRCRARCRRRCGWPSAPAPAWPGSRARAGERGAIEAGALPSLLPGGRAVTDPAARAEVARAWGVGSLPASTGRDTGEILDAAATGQLSALLVAGVDPADLPDPAAALAALAAASFVVSLELRVSAVTDRADVVFPVAAVAEKAGTFVNWEGRPGPSGPRFASPRSGPTCRSWPPWPTRWTCT